MIAILTIILAIIDLSVKIIFVYAAIMIIKSCIIYISNNKSKK